MSASLQAQRYQDWDMHNDIHMSDTGDLDMNNVNVVYHKVMSLQNLEARREVARNDGTFLGISQEVM